MPLTARLPQLPLPGTLSIVGCLLCLVLTRSVTAQNDKTGLDQSIGIEAHSWAGFATGSWKLVRITKEVFDIKGKLESVTIQEGKTTLTAVTEDRFTLLEEITLEVAGKRFPAVPREIERGLNNETKGQTVTSRLLRKDNVVICRREIPSQVHEITIADENTKRVSTVYYAADVPPFILKRDTVCTDEKGQASYESYVEVLALDMPHRVLTEVKPAAHIKTVHVQVNQVQPNSNHTTVTLEVSCASVPGHIVAHTAKKITADGRLTERSTLELLGYGVVAKQAQARGLGRQRLFGKRRLHGSPR